MLEQKIKNKKAVIGIIGLGYVGLPLAIEFLKAGFEVIGLDLAKEKINLLKKGKSYVLDVADKDIEYAIKSKKFKPTANYKDLASVDCISIAVPTPLRKSKDPDISFIVLAISQLKPYLHKEMLIVLESTTYPGTTRELIGSEIENAGFTVGKDIFVAFSPERVDPGNKKYHTKNTPKVIGGLSKKCTKTSKLLYEQVIDIVVTVNSAEEAEMVKLLENTFRAVNIALVNEMLLMCSRMNIDIWSVIEAASTKPFGFMPFYPGPGLGGHCIPLDPMYLSWKAKTFNFYNRFIELASDINSNMPYFAINQCFKLLNKHHKTVKGSKIMLLGMAYKNDINDLRESPALEIYELLKEEGAIVSFYDPYIESFFDRTSSEVTSIKDLNIKAIKEQDCLILTTNHQCFNLELIIKNAKLILDTRNAFKDFFSPNLFKL